MSRKILALALLFLTIALVFCACADTDNNKAEPDDTAGKEPSGDSISPPSDTDVKDLTDLTPVQTYTVVFDYSDGSAKDTFTVTAGEKINAPETPVRTDYEFNGWLAGTQAAEFPFEVTKDVTFKASWSYVDPYFYTQPESNVTLSQGDRQGLEVEVKLQKGHYFTYQWFVNSAADTSGAAAVEGATDRILALPEDMAIGQHYFYCQVTVHNFKSGEVTDTFCSNFSRAEVKKAPVNILVVGSGTVRQDGKHDSLEFLESLLKAGGMDVNIESITRSSNYNIWESGLTGENQSTVRAKLESKKFSFIILQMGRDYAVCTQTTRDKEVEAYKNILAMTEELAPDCQVILIEGPWRQDMTTKYYVDRFIPAGIDTNDKHKEAIRALFAEYILPIKDDVKLCDMITAFEQAQEAGLDPYGSASNDFPGTCGSYLLACMCYANITGNSPEGLNVTSNSLGSIKLGDAQTLQKIAAQVVLGK